ncbi:MAG: PQQ-binding-like beta-propeller repeat protein, partial [Planctomycetes bacterium]|nr:PQQ-binding-like beta-propeller repeat protein [Planctomycetota bacterium]
GVGPGAVWGLLGKDARNSSSALAELVPPLIQKWRYPAAGAAGGSLITLPPVYAGGGLVYLAKEDNLVALDATSGIVRWSAPLHVQRMKTRTNTTIHGLTWGLEGKLGVSQGVIGGIDSDNEIRAFDAATGASLWSRMTDVPRADGGPSGKARAKAARGDQGPLEHMEILSATRQCFIVREGDKLRSFALRTGRMEWQADVQSAALPLAVESGAALGNFPVRLDRAVLESDGILVHAYGDSIRAIDTLSGRDLWEVKIPLKNSPPTGPWASYFTMISDGVARAAIAGDLLLILAVADGKLSALDLRTGRLRWDLAGDALVTESQLACDDQNVYALVNKALGAYALKSGAKAWRREAKGYQPPNGQGLPPPGVVQSRMTVAGSRIYLSSSEEQGGESSRLEALDRKTGMTLWEYPWESLGRVLNGLRTVGLDMWGRPIPAQTSAPVICEGWLYVVRSDGQLYSFHGKTQELAALRDAVRRDPESPQARFQLGDLLGSEGQNGLEMEEYRSALKFALKKPETAALRELVTEVKSRLFVRLMRQGESATDFEVALKSFAEARAYVDGPPSLARVLVRTAAVLLALDPRREGPFRPEALQGGDPRARQGPPRVPRPGGRRHLLRRLGPARPLPAPHGRGPALARDLPEDADGRRQGSRAARVDQGARRGAAQGAQGILGAERDLLLAAPEDLGEPRARRGRAEAPGAPLRRAAPGDRPGPDLPA